ncbi:MAG: transposase, partial [Candidatus Heimdallarchaeota archaeon]|nr:transposase [Candidatus Heimdallarchaeota archaeon]
MTLDSFPGFSFPKLHYKIEDFEFNVEEKDRIRMLKKVAFEGIGKIIFERNLDLDGWYLILELISKLIFFGYRRMAKMQFRELSDDEWALIQPVLPPKAPTGRPRADDRQTSNGILYVLLTGCR